MRPEFSEFIVNARRNKRLTQVEAAKKIHITQAQISNIEKGLNFPSVETLINMSIVYDVTLDDLLGVKRERNITVVLGDASSEMRFLSKMNNYHRYITEKIKDRDTKTYEEDMLSSIELFKYGKTICEERINSMECKIKETKYLDEQFERYEKFDKTLKERDQLEKEGKDTRAITKELKKQHHEMKKANRKFKV